MSAPYNIPGEEAAIFWFGPVTPTKNSVDVRVSYQEDHLYVRLSAMDRRLWFDQSPSSEDLTAWDAATLYLDTAGNAGLAPSIASYRFEAQLSVTPSREGYQAAYQGNGDRWVAASLPFTTTVGWAGNYPNDEVDDRGWAPKFLIPYSALGLSAPPAEGTLWGMAVALHDRDDAEGTPIEDQVWPETMQPEQPATWGQLQFGNPGYSPPPASGEGKVTIRQGLEGATVVDADVGGSSICGAPAAPDYFPTWGELNWAGKTFVNIQNLGAIGDWPCFSRTYVTFPLDAMPANQVILSATLTLYLWGGAGEGCDPDPQPSLIQVLTVDGGWTESSVTWNNAPLARENISATWVYPVDDSTPPEGIPYHWNVSRAVAEAYAAGTPLHLALYEADWATHSGKYFHSSDVGPWNAEGRPTLTVAWGRAAAKITKTATPTSGFQHDPITYTLSFLGTGQTLALTDTLPAGISTPDRVLVEGSSIPPLYNGICHCLTWSDSPAPGQEITIRYRARIVASARQALRNAALLTNSSGGSSRAAAVVLANPLPVYLPLVLKGAWSSPGHGVRNCTLSAADLA
ncbi:MAG: DNRLRE domain-containing protein [Anaerolineae bacterium]|nr:DNRLRE domain-containing protein [Anaerolineae bacterium]